MSHTHTHTYTHIHPYIHPYIHANTHPHTDTHTQTHTQTYMLTSLAQQQACMARATGTSLNPQHFDIICVYRNVERAVGEGVMKAQSRLPVCAVVSVVSGDRANNGRQGRAGVAVGALYL